MKNKNLHKNPNLSYSLRTMLANICGKSLLIFSIIFVGLINLKNVSAQTVGCPNPPTPSNMTYSSNTTSVTIDFNNNFTNGTIPVGYSYKYKRPGYPWTSWVQKTTKPILISGLVAGKVYDIEVRTDCSSTSFSAPLVKTFPTKPDFYCPSPVFSISNKTTNGATITFNPAGLNASKYKYWYQEGTGSFGSSCNLPACTEVLSTATSNTITTLKSSTPYRVTVVADCELNGLSTSNTYAQGFTTLPAPVCPPPTGVYILSTSINEATVNFMHQAGQGITDFVYYYRTRPRTTITWSSWSNARTPVFHFNSSTIKEFTITGLSPMHDIEVKVASKCGSNPSIEVTAPWSFTKTPPCTTPTDLSVSNNTTGTSVTINFTTPLQTYEVSTWAPGQPTVSRGTITSNTTSPDKSISISTGIAPEITYTVLITSRACAGSAPGATTNFTPPRLCTTPANLQASNITKETARINFTSPVRFFDVHTRVNGTSSWVFNKAITYTTGGININKSTDITTGLAPLTKYDVRLTSTKCYGSSQGATTTFTTLGPCPAPTNLQKGNFSTASSCNFQFTLPANAPSTYKYLMSFKVGPGGSWINSIQVPKSFPNGTNYGTWQFNLSNYTSQQLFFRVHTICSGSPSGYSNVLIATIPSSKISNPGGEGDDLQLTEAETLSIQDDKTINEEVDIEYLNSEILSEEMLLNIENNTQANNVIIPFPNPIMAGEELQIDGISEGAAVSIYSLDGKLVINKILSDENQKKIKIPSDLPAAIYMIKLTTISGDVLFKKLAVTITN